MNKKKISLKLLLIIVIAIIVVSLYVGGCISQWFMPKTSIDGWTVVEVNKTFNPLVCFKYAITTKTGSTISFVIIAIIVCSYMFIKLCTQKNPLHDERDFDISPYGTYGTSGWMTQVEIAENFDVKPVKQTTGTILGMIDDKVVSLPMNSKLNKHTAIYGASGTGKSRCFVRPQIIQCVARGESVIITDPKGEIYADTAQFMRNNGYTVKMFNLVNPKYSDSWNCLQEINSNPEQIELMAQTFSDVIIKNTSPTGGSGKDPFWDNAEMNLLKALCLLILTDEARDDTQKNIGAVYELLTSTSEAKLTAMFDRLPQDHAARKPWTIFKQGSESVRGNVIISLGSRLQVFQAPDIVSITTSPEIDLELPAREKCAMFVIMSDQDSTLDFLSSLMFSFLFIRLVRYADVHGKNGACDVPVNFILDEFPNIGQIPDFCKKLSTIRSRDLRVAVIFQNLAQLQNRYPNGLWEEIVGNCDTQLFLGCTDATTAKFISERTGEMTIAVHSESTKREALSPISSNPNYQVSESQGKRAVLTPDEVMRLPNTNALVLLRGQKVVKVKKFDYSLHPTHEQFVHTYVKDYVPEWAKKEKSVSPIIDNDLAQNNPKQIERDPTPKGSAKNREDPFAEIVAEANETIDKKPQTKMPQKLPPRNGSIERPVVADSRPKYVGDLSQFATRIRKGTTINVPSGIASQLYQHAQPVKAVRPSMQNKQSPVNPYLNNSNTPPADF